MKKEYSELMMVAIAVVGLWPALEAEFYSATIVNEDFGSLSVMDILLKESREMMDFEVIKKDLPEHFQIVAGPEFSSILTGMKLKPEESFIISRFEGTRYITIDMLSALTGFPEE